ncbi:MAG: fumarate reductase subunit FrdD [Candidatus Binatia bacterium]
MAQRRPIEPFLWLLFSIGGVLAALFVPILVLLFGLAFPLGWLSPPTHEHLLAVLSHPITRLVVFGLCMMSLFHAAHRIRYTLHDGIRLKHPIVDAVCYGGAVIGTIWAAYWAITVA